MNLCEQTYLYNPRNILPDMGLCFVSFTGISSFGGMGRMMNWSEIWGGRCTERGEFFLGYTIYLLPSLQLIRGLALSCNHAKTEVKENWWISFLYLIHDVFPIELLFHGLDELLARISSTFFAFLFVRRQELLHHDGSLGGLCPRPRRKPRPTDWFFKWYKAIVVQRIV